jgi:hypothetical protein
MLLNYALARLILAIPDRMLPPLIAPHVISYRGLGKHKVPFSTHWVMAIQFMVVRFFLDRAMGTTLGWKWPADPDGREGGASVNDEKTGRQLVSADRDSGDIHDEKTLSTESDSGLQ